MFTVHLKKHNNLLISITHEIVEIAFCKKKILNLTKI